MTPKLKLNIIIGYIVLVAFLFVYIVLTTSEDHDILRIQSWSAESSYVVERVEPENLSIPITGRLGAFYSCLTKYGGLGTRRITRPNNGIEEWLVLRLEDRTKIDILMNAMEGFSFNLTLYDQNNTIVGASQLYAINCDMELLGKPDSDMHCEDKVLGNEIRPVCTYRPQQPPSQDSLKG